MEVTPIEKVISLIEGMHKEVADDGKAEAVTYNSFACFCKSTTTAKSNSIKNGNDAIDAQSANIADKTASQTTDSTELSGRKAKQEKLSADLDNTVARCTKEKATYEAEANDMNKALSSLKSALKSMKDSKPAAALLQGAVRDDLAQTIALAEAMNMVSAPKTKAIASMIQKKASVDPNDPEYKFHSNDIVDLLATLQTDFKKEKKDLDDEYAKSKKACDEMKASLKKEMGANVDAMKALSKNIQKLAKEIAGHRESLIQSQGDMKDDEAYLKDMTARCEDRADDFDQRSAMRRDELSALSQALSILKKDVKSAADEVNERALLIQKLHKPELRKPEAAPVAVSKPVTASSPKPSKPVQKSIALIQGFLSSKLSKDVQKEQALALIAKEGERLNSLVLTSLAQSLAADPFEKIKGLIQKLIERLLAESAGEATKKGFCDTELGKARKDREFRFEETQDLSAELERLEANEDALTAEIKLLTNQIKHENEALKTATSDRKDEKAENIKTVATARDGLEAVGNALLTLRSFYKQAAKASFIQASPVDEDTSGAGFSGAYAGKQSSSKAVLSLLETIESDFDRTVRTTEAAEEAAHRDFVSFSQHSQASIAGKTTKKELDEQDLKSTKTSLETKMADLQTAQKLLDDALKELEGLKPACIDTGMSYKERVAKREEEMKALQKALCILGEPGCSGP